VADRARSKTLLNRCEFIGNLGRDPECRTTASGERVVNLNLAVSEKYKDKNGERQERTEWVRITIWNEKLGEVAERYCKKGDKIFVAGAMQTRKWTDQSGAEKYTTEIVLQRFRGELVLLGGGGERQEPAQDYGTQRQAPAQRGGRMAADLDDDLPF
jgi:single-strand DNA-binding protein